jgi:Zn-dependent peptidase ImmA (M78 family)
MEELGGAAARWLHKTKTILIAPDLWDELEWTTNPELRFTIFHEVGHAVLKHSDRNRNFGGAFQAGKTVERDEDEADRFAMAFVMPLTISTSANVADKQALIRNYGLPEDKTELRMVDLQMHVRHASHEAEVAIHKIEMFDAETWLRNTAFRNKHVDRSVPTKNEDWDF